MEFLLDIWNYEGLQPEHVAWASDHDWFAGVGTVDGKACINTVSNKSFTDFEKLTIWAGY